MIVNIPVQIDEHIFEKKIQSDYDRIIENKIVQMVENTLAEGSWRIDAKDGMRDIINRKVNNCMKEWKNEIIEAAAKELAARVKRTKASRERLESD